MEIAPDGKPRQYFCDTHEQLAEHLHAIDARGNAAYHACGVFKIRSRKATDALGAQCLWLDIDCGEDKVKKRLGYASTDIALQELSKFEDAYGLPAPTIVRSGHGLHVYWKLTDMANPEEWLHCARLLKAATERHGLLADKTRTADLASILRPAGTFNRKKETPAPVYVEYDDCEPIDIEALAELLALPVMPTMPAHIQQISSVAQAMANGSKQSVFQPVSEGGRNDALARAAGAWFAQKKTYEEVLVEARAWNQKNQPPLGDDELVRTVDSIYRKEQTKPSAPLIALGDCDMPRPDLPEGFSASVGGAMYAHYEDELGNAKVARMAAFECYLIAVCRKENVAEESYAFVANHPHNGWHRFLVDSGDFQSPACMQIMTRNCASITHIKFFKNYVEAASIKLKGTNMDTVRHEQFGWKENNQAFLIGNALIRRGGVVDYAYGDDQLEKRMQAFKIPSNTSLSAWSALGNKLFGPGFDAHAFGLLTSFGTVLMPFLLGATDGGAVLALHTQGSGFGKTNTLQAIASVWGSYDALSVAGCDTENAMFAIITRGKNLPIIEEEMGKRDPALEASIVKRLITGKEKNRATRDGGVEFRSTRYQTIMISASNHSLAETLRASGDEGAMARCFEITIEAPTDKELFKEFSRITAQMLAHCGHAGRAFMYNLLLAGNLEAVIPRLIAAEEAYWDILKTTGKDRYIAKMLACNKIAGELVNQFEILSFSVDRVMEWAIARARIRAEETAVDTAIDVLNRFIIENSQDCLVAEGVYNPKKPPTITNYPKNKLIMRLEKENNILYISQSVLRQWLIKANYHYSTIVKALLEKEILITDKRQVTLSAGTHYPPARCLSWVVNMNSEEVSGMVRSIAPQENTPNILPLPIQT